MSLSLSLRVIPRPIFAFSVFLYSWCFVPPIVFHGQVKSLKSFKAVCNEMIKRGWALTPLWINVAPIRRREEKRNGEDTSLRTDRDDCSWSLFNMWAGKRLFIMNENDSRLSYEWKAPSVFLHFSSAGMCACRSIFLQGTTLRLGCFLEKSRN